MFTKFTVVRVDARGAALRPKFDGVVRLERKGCARIPKLKAQIGCCRKMVYSVCVRAMILALLQQPLTF